jgi:hypothetical protein
MTRNIGIVAALVLAGPGAVAAPLGPLVGAGETPLAPWAYAGLPKQALPATRYSVREIDGRRVLRIEAERSYGNLVHPLAGVTAGVLSWRWRVERPITAADLRHKDGDDAALKVCAMFDLPQARVPFIERQLLRLAESRTGEALPTATLCYVWEPSLPRGTVLPNAHTRRVRFVTLGGAPGQWQAERHDLAVDFRRAFADESQTVPPLIAIAVGADADNTGAHSVAFLDALTLEPR